MKLEHEMIVERIDSTAGALYSLSHLLGIADNTADTISLEHLAQLIGVIAFATQSNAAQIDEVLRTAE